MKKSFTQLESPVLAGVVKEETAKSVIAEIKNNSLSGANAFDVHISCLGKEECTAEKLKQIADSTCKPIMALHYNQAYDLGPMNESDEDRMRRSSLRQRQASLVWICRVIPLNPAEIPKPH